MARYLCGDKDQRAAFRTLWSRLDQITGYPRTHSADEHGVRVARGRPLPYTETLFAGFVHDDTGATVLHGAVALMVDDPPDGLMRRRITHADTERTLAEWIAWGEANRGWVVRATLPGVESAWTQVAPRDGGEGSADGKPIPEGEELTAGDTPTRTR